MRQLLPVLLAAASLAGAAPVRVIFDTDMGNDIDDAVVLAILHARESRGEAKLLADGRHRYLMVNETQRARTLEAMIALASQPR